MSERRIQAVFVISVAAELAGMHPQTLRIYERKGLIDPYRTPGGTRRYSQEDIERLTLIQTLTSKGLNLEGTNTITPSRLHVPLPASSALASACVDPSAMSIRFSLPSAKNPMDRLSGDQKGFIAPSVPGNGCTVV